MEQLIHMNLSSLRGYQEIVDSTHNPQLRDFADVMLRQRSAQCRELAAGWHDLTALPEESDPAADQVRLHWARALWSVDQELAHETLEAIEEAEQVLEDAYLKAAALYADCPISQLFTQHATSVCGARQRLEEGLEAESLV